MDAQRGARRGSRGAQTARQQVTQGQPGRQQFFELQRLAHKGGSGEVSISFPKNTITERSGYSHRSDVDSSFADTADRPRPPLSAAALRA